MKRYKRVLLCYGFVQFMVALYMRWLRKNPSQYIWIHRRECEKLVVKDRNSHARKVTLYPVKIYRILCDEPVVFIDELDTFNLTNRGLHLEDALIESFCSFDITDEGEACISCGVHIALIITSFTIDYLIILTNFENIFEYQGLYFWLFFIFFLIGYILVSVGDIVAIPWHKPWNRKVKEIFFKILRFEDSEGLLEAIVDSQNTTLYQDGEIYDKIPYSDITCYVPEKFVQIAQRISSLVTANCGMETSLSTLVILLSGSPASTNTFSLLALLNADLLGYNSDGAKQDSRGLVCLTKLLKSRIIPIIFLVCNSNKLSTLPISLRSLVLYHFQIPTLTEDDRKSIIMHELVESNLIDIAAIGYQTSGFTLSDLHILLSDASFRKDATNSPMLKTEHFMWAIDERNKRLADKIGAPTIPKVTWDDIGGLDDVKQIVIESLILNLQAKKNMKRSGVLLYGPPGCGKTLIAKGSNLVDMPLIAVVKGPELLNKYVGQSEANVRRVFDKARMAEPCVLFFDELDSLASRQGRCGDSSRVVDNIVSQLTTELDCLEDSKIFILGATNRLDLLDSSLLRSGRFDKVIEVSGTRDVVTRECILRAASRNITFADGVNLKEIAELCGHLSSGADLHAIISRAQMDAIRKRIEAIEAGLALPEEQLLITQDNLKMQ
ncbi:Peroxisome biogenesis protein 6 [Dirofilaria immitis]|nr:Peroxisome biogenesis protein 6 [Dirofilaria immitis]